MVFRRSLIASGSASATMGRIIESQRAVEVHVMSPWEHRSVGRWDMRPARRSSGDGKEALRSDTCATSGAGAWDPAGDP